MLNEEMQQAVTEVSAGDAVVALQVIARAAASGILKDHELKIIGTAREHLVGALQASTGVNFDQARAAQVAEHQRKMAEVQRRAQEQRARAAQAAPKPGQAVPAGPEPVASDVVMANRVPPENTSGDPASAPVITDGQTD